MAYENEQRIRAQVAKWRDELLDLTGRNRLLRFRHTKVSSLEIQSPSAQEVLDRLLDGRSREWAIHVPEEPSGDVDPTAAVVGLGEASESGSDSKDVVDALDRLGSARDGAHVWLSFGAIRWREAVWRTAALALVSAEVRYDDGWRVRLRDHELVVNRALLAHFEREHGVTLGEDRYRIENAGIQAFLDELREAFAPLDAEVDDRIGLISESQHEAVLEGQIDLMPAVLVSEAPRGGVLAEIGAADEAGLPLLPTVTRVLGIPIARLRRDVPMLVTTKRTAKEVNASCAGVSRRAAQEFMDKGLWILYLGIGMLHWSDPADGRAEFQDSPLVLVPVAVEAGNAGNGWRVRPTEDEPLVNPALWLKLESDLGITLPEIDLDEQIDVASTLDAVRDAVAPHPDWNVEERVVLSLFSFHKEAMFRDLRDNIDHIVERPVIAALAAEPGSQVEDQSFDFEPIPEERLDVEAPPEQVASVLDADVSQRQCVVAAVQGRSFVMDGPPGTGKSQTIANQIAELIAAGKKVLFVSEKAAALDVVYNRLQKVGLHEYVLELHSHKTTRAAVASALGESLRRRPRPAPILTGRDLTEAARRREHLNHYAEAINNPIDALGGRSLHDLLGWIANLQHVPQAPVAAGPITDVAELEAIRELAERLRSTWEVVDRGADFVWRGASASAWSATTEQQVRTSLHDALDALDRLADAASLASGDLLLDEPAGPAAAERFVALLHVIEQRPEGVLPEWLLAAEPDVLQATAERVTARVQRASDARAQAAATAGPRWSDLSPDPEGARDARAKLGDLEAMASARAEQLERLASSAAEIGTVAGELRTLAEDMAVTLGLRAIDLTLDDAERIARLGALAAAEDQPIASWLTAPDGVETARAAYDRLTPLVTAERDARKQAEAFEETVLELDLAALAPRFREQHRGLKKLSSAYRADRDTLSRTAPGLTPKQAIEAIDAAVAWQTAHRALTAAEDQTAVLGEAWNGASTDLRAMGSRLEVAKDAIELAGGRIVDARRFAETLSGDATSPDLSEDVARLERAVGRIRSITPDALSSLWSLALGAMITQCGDLEVALSRAGALTADVDRVRGSAGSFADAIAAHEARAEVESAAEEHAADSAAETVLGPHWSRLEIEPTALSAAVEWAVEARERVAGPVGRASAERLATVTPAVAPLDSALSRWSSVRDLVLLAFDPGRRRSVADDLEGDFTDARALLKRLDETRSDIGTWLSHASAIQALNRTGVEPAVRYCLERDVPASQVVDVLRRSALEATADAQLAAHAEALGPLRADDRDRLVQEYASVDRRIVGDAAQRVMERANALRPSSAVGVAAIIRNEAAKSRRHMPVATLLAKTADVAQALKPCFMMSPLSVSQFLSPSMRFDVVIFDEASQVRPCDAINALYRGNAMIVAGDQKQLPPTSFFDQSTDDGDDWNEEDLAEFDSVLDLAKGSGAFRSLSLRWHYRSRHESLIAFSNYRFYGGDLVTFPGPAEQADGLGVELFQVDGAYRRGTSRDNPIEAQAIADRIFWHASRGARSIGVVAFSEAQASLIEAVLRQDERSNDPRFEALLDGGRLDGLFVKNLENVQGDERDIIIFSVGYGPDENGKLTMGFGPINREGGWRRLNVAITRARMRVEVVCSFSAERLAESGNKGVDALRRYLDFAARGPAALAIDDVQGDGGEPESPFEDSVLRTIRSWGYEVAAQVGTAGYRIDMAVRQPDRPGHFSLGIECDGAMYHSSKVARDRDRLRQQVLEGLGWTLYRIWGPSWYRDRAGEERRLREAIERSLMAGPPTPQTSEPEPLPITVAFEDLDLEAPPLWAEPYTVAQLYAPHSADPAEMTANAELRRLVLHTTTEEGPIVEDLLVRRVIGAWSTMVTERRREAVQNVIAQLLGAGTLVNHGNAYALPNQRIDIVRVPADGDARTEREVKHVPDVELAESLARLVEEARLVTDEEAVMRVARLFGWRRTGSAIQATLSRVVEGLIDDGRVSRDGMYLRRGTAADAVSD